MIPIAPNPQYRNRWRWTERWFVLTFDPEVTDVPTAVDKLSGLQGVAYVEPNYRNKLELTPNDPYYSGHQWYVQKTNAHRVWDFTTGRPDVILSAVDSGVDYLHPDLGGGIGAGYKVIGGYDTGDGVADPMPSGEAHGTACAGIAAGDHGTIGDYIGGVELTRELNDVKFSKLC